MVTSTEDAYLPQQESGLWETSPNPELVVPTQLPVALGYVFQEDTQPRRQRFHLGESPVVLSKLLPCFDFSCDDFCCAFTFADHSQIKAR